MKIDLMRGMIDDRRVDCIPPFMLFDGSNRIGAFVAVDTKAGTYAHLVRLPDGTVRHDKDGEPMVRTRRAVGRLLVIWKDKAPERPEST